MGRKIQYAWPMIVLGATMFLGCKAAPAPNVGFADPKLMKADKTVPFDEFWRKPDVDWSSYKKIYIAEVNTEYMLKQTDWQKGERQGDIEKDVKKLADFSRESIKKAFRDDPRHRFEVIDEPTKDPHVLVMEFAIIEVVPSKVLLNALGYTPFFIGTGITVVRSIANDKSSAAFELRIRDAGTNEIMVLAADREAEQFAVVDVRGLTWYSDAEGIVADWSQQFVRVVNMKPGETVEDTATFRLLPW